MWLVSEQKTEAVNAYLIKNSKGEGGGRQKNGVKGGGHSHKQSEGLSGVAWVYKIGLKWPVIEMAIARKTHYIYLSERDRELEL